VYETAGLPLVFDLCPFQLLFFDQKKNIYPLPIIKLMPVYLFFRISCYSLNFRTKVVNYLEGKKNFTSLEEFERRFRLS
jgi:hypothetical protein